MSGSGNQLYLNHLLVRHNITLLQPVSWLSVKSMITNSYQIATGFYCYLWVVWHSVSAALCLPCPALPASAMLCCLFPAVELSWFAEPVFPVVCTYPGSPDPSCPLAGSCRMVELLPVGVSWTASVGFSRGMVGRESSGWGWSYLRVEGWRSQIT